MGMAEAIMSKLGKPESKPKSKPESEMPSDTMKVALGRAYAAVKSDKPDEFISAVRAAIHIGRAEEELGD